MAGDIGIREKIIILPRENAVGILASELTRSLSRSGGRIMHQYGDRVLLAEVQPGGEASLAFEGLEMPLSLGFDELPEDLTETERLGIEAFALRQSPEYSDAKAQRPRQGESWDGSDGGKPLMCGDVGVPPGEQGLAAGAGAGAPALSTRLTGRVAVGIVIVNGPTAALQFTAAERTKVVAEVQNGLGWLGAQNDAGAVSFLYEVQNVAISETPLTGSPTADQMESRFRDPAMAKIGYAAGLGNVTQYANDLRTKLKTDWAYIVFFTKYPVYHFAYASIGGPRIIMDYANDGWGPDNIDRVFTHETGHIFGAPDEYASSGCTCGGSWGYFGKPNSNCENCAPGGGVKCLMKGNDWEMCSVTPYHLGFPLAEQRYSGVFRGGSGKHALWINGSYDSFVAKWQEWAGQGLRLADLDIVQVGNERRYNGVWTAGTEAYGLWLNADWNAFVAKWQEWSKQNLRLVSMDVVRFGTQNLYSGVFRGGTDAYGLWGNATWESFVAKWQEWSKQNLRLVDLVITNFGNERRYSGVFRGGTDGYGLWVNADWPGFQAKWQEWSKANLRLVDLEINTVGGKRLYSGVFRGGSDGYGLWVNANWPNFKAKWDEWSAQGLRLIDLEVTDPANTGNAPVPTISAAAALGVEADENGGDGYGGIFNVGGNNGLTAADLDTGAMVPGSAATPIPSSVSGGESGFGGMFDGTPPSSSTASAWPSSESGISSSPASSSDGFGGIGGGSVAGSTTDTGGGQDGFGGLGGESGEPGARATADLDVGGYGGLG